MTDQPTSPGDWSYQVANDNSVIASLNDDGSVIAEGYDVGGQLVDVRIIPSPDVCADPKHAEKGRCPTCGFVVPSA